MWLAIAQLGRVILVLIQPFKHAVPFGFLILLWFCSQKYLCFHFSAIFGGVVSFWDVLNHKGPPLWWKIEKIVQKLFLIAQKKRPDALNTTQKTPAIKNSFWTFFSISHHKGGPLWFKTSQKLTTPPKMAEKWKQKYFCEQNYKWIKNPDGTVCLKGWIKIRISLLLRAANKVISQRPWIINWIIYLMQYQLQRQKGEFGCGMKIWPKSICWYVEGPFLQSDDDSWSPTFVTQSSRLTITWPRSTGGFTTPPMTDKGRSIHVILRTTFCYHWAVAASLSQLGLFTASYSLPGCPALTFVYLVTHGTKVTKKQSIRD